MKKIHGGDIYSYDREMLDFSANINPLGIPEEVKTAISASVSGSEVYPDTEYRRLREAIANIEQVSPENIVCGNGAADLIFNIVLALKPKKVLLLAPTFAEYEKAADSIDCEKIFYTLKEENNFEIGTDFIEQVGKSDMVFICRPNNPVGNCMSLNQLLSVLDECRKANTFAVLDECFMDFTTDEESAMKYVESYDNILILKAFTKMFALPGVRLGYGICSNAEVIEKIYDVRQPWNVSHTAEMAGIAACGIYEDTVKKTRRFIETERSFISSELKRLGIKYFEPSANYVFFKAYDGLKQDMADRGILIRACGNYRGLTNEFYRIAVRGREDNKRLISALEECLWQRR